MRDKTGVCLVEKFLTVRTTKTRGILMIFNGEWPFLAMKTESFNRHKAMTISH